MIDAPKKERDTRSDHGSFDGDGNFRQRDRGRIVFGRRAPPQLASGAVRAVLTDWALPPVDLWAVFPTGRMASAKARAFTAFIEETLGA
jgi:hypothetical protein